LSKLLKRTKDFFKEYRKPVSFRILSKKLLKKGGNKSELRAALKLLLDEGSIIKHKGGLYQSAITKTPKKHSTHDEKTYEGKIDLHPEGYGFFIFNDLNKDDVFIPRMKTNGAMHGDKVLVTLGEYRGKVEGRVVKILERGFRYVVGRVVKSDYFAHVIAFDKKLDKDIYLPKKYAKELKDDDIVFCEIVDYGTKGSNPEGKLIKKLGRMTDDGIDNLIVMSKYDLRVDFPKSVIRETDNIEKLLEKTADRADLTKLFTVTIDGETARDFDDAISIDKTEKGYKLFVHIADVSHFVTQGSAIDSEAFKRGTSVYFPEFAIPMLPEKLSNELCSLMPRVKRLSMTAEIDYDNFGNRISYKMYSSFIKSNYRLTYDFVNDFYEKKEKVTNHNLSKLLNNSKELADLVRQRRKKQGSIDFDLPETEFKFDEQGNIIEIKPLERGISHRLIEMFMIEANEAVAEFLEQKLETSIFRVHAKPDSRKLADFVKTAHLFGVDVEFPDEITPVSVQKISEEILESGKQNILSPRLVRTMQKAVYSIENIGHFGLASKSYTHFTSPIRRYPDLVIHRLLKLVLYKEKLFDDDLKKIADHSSDMEQKSEDAEREIHLYKKLRYLEANKDLEWDAYINRVTADGVFVYLENLLMTGFVPIDFMSEKDMFYLDTERQMLVSRFSDKKYKIGDIVKVHLELVNFDTLETAFSLL
jgi:ribonuclease R